MSGGAATRCVTGYPCPKKRGNGASTKTAANTGSSLSRRVRIVLRHRRAASRSERDRRGTIALGMRSATPSMVGSVALSNALAKGPTVKSSAEPSQLVKNASRVAASCSSVCRPLCREPLATLAADGSGTALPACCRQSATTTGRGTTTRVPASKRTPSATLESWSPVAAATRIASWSKIAVPVTEPALSAPSSQSCGTTSQNIGRGTAAQRSASAKTLANERSAFPAGRRTPGTTCAKFSTSVSCSRYASEVACRTRDSRKHRSKPLRRRARAHSYTIPLRRGNARQAPPPLSSSTTPS